MVICRTRNSPVSVPERSFRCNRPISETRSGRSRYERSAWRYTYVDSGQFIGFRLNVCSSTSSLNMLSL